MNSVQGLQHQLICVLFVHRKCAQSVTSPASEAAEKLGFMKLCGINMTGLNHNHRSLMLNGNRVRSTLFKRINAKEDSDASLIDDCSRRNSKLSAEHVKTNLFKPIKAKEDSDLSLTDDSAAFFGTFSKFRFLFFLGS